MEVQSPNQPGLAWNNSRERASTASLGNLFCCFTTHTVKNFFLITSLNLPSFQFKPVTLCPVATSAVNKFVPIFLRNPFQELEGCYKVSPQPSLLQTEQPQLPQPFLIGEVFQHSDQFCGPPLDPLQHFNVLLMLGAPELDTGLPGGIS